MRPRDSAAAYENRQYTDGSDDYTEDDDDENPDFSGFDEPIVIRLMANMFSQKKSVKEGLQMLPEISIEKIKKELDNLKAQKRAKIEKEKRDHI